MFLIVGIGSKIVATVMLLLYFSITDLMLLRRTLRLELPSEDEEEDHPKKIPKKMRKKSTVVHPENSVGHRKVNDIFMTASPNKPQNGTATSQKEREEGANLVNSPSERD